VVHAVIGRDHEGTRGVGDRHRGDPDGQVRIEDRLRPTVPAYNPRVTETLGALVGSGSAALQRADWTAARDAFRAALDEDETPEALSGLGNALWWMDDLRQSVECRERAYAGFRRRGDLADAAMVAITLVFDYRKQYGNAGASAGWLARAARLIEDAGVDEMSGWLLFARAYDSEDPATSERLAREAGDFARLSRDTDLELCALSQIGAALVAQGRVPEGVACLEEALAGALAGEGAMPDTVVMASCQMMTCCTQCADFERATQWVLATVASPSSTAAPSSMRSAASSTGSCCWRPASGPRQRRSCWPDSSSRAARSPP